MQEHGVPPGEFTPSLQGTETKRPLLRDMLPVMVNFVDLTQSRIFEGRKKSLNERCTVDYLVGESKAYHLNSVSGCGEMWPTVGGQHHSLGGTGQVLNSERVEDWS